MTIIQSYRENLLHRRQSINTIETYCGHILRFFAFLESTNQFVAKQSLQNLSVDMCVSFYAYLFDRQLSPGTLNTYVCAIRDFFRYLLKFHIIHDDPSTCLDTVAVRFNPRVDSKVAFTDAEIMKIRDATLLRTESQAAYQIALRNWAFIALSLATAMRVSETISLKARDMKHLEAGSVRVKIKGGRQEEIAVAGFAIPALDEYLCLRKALVPDDPLFVTTAGKPWNRKRVWDSIKSIQEAAGVPTGLHYFRVTTISRLGYNNALARDVARHSTRSVTERYTPTTVKERREAIEQAYQHLIFS